GLDRLAPAASDRLVHSPGERSAGRSLRRLARRSFGRPRSFGATLAAVEGATDFAFESLGPYRAVGEVSDEERGEDQEHHGSTFAHVLSSWLHRRCRSAGPRIPFDRWRGSASFSWPSRRFRTDYPARRTRIAARPTPKAAITTTNR